MKTIGPRVAIGVSLFSITGLLAGCGGGSSRGGGAALAPSTAGSTSATPAAVAVPTSGTTATGPVAQAPSTKNTGPSLVLDLSGKGAFLDTPFPSDARRTAAGGPDFSDAPNPKKVPYVRAIHALASETPGFSPAGTVYFRFDAPIHAPPDDPLESVKKTSPVLLVDIDPRSPERLSRRPFRAQLTRRSDSCRPANLLQLLPVPGLSLRRDTTHAAIVLRSLGAPGTPWLGQHPDLALVLEGKVPAGPQGAAFATAMKPLVTALRDLGLHPDDVAAATVFTTGDPTAQLIKQVDWAVAQPPLKPLNLGVRDDWPTFRALKGEVMLPAYQQGSPPYPVSGGRQVVNALGHPVRQYDAKAQFQLSIPKGKMPAKGFPLYFYIHGTGGLPGQAIDRGRWINSKQHSPEGQGIASYVSSSGWATSCLALHLSPTRIGFLSADGYIPYNFFNPVAMRDNFFQMILELVHFRSMVLDLRIDPALCPGTDASAAPDGKIRFDPDTMVVGGQSLGSYLAGMTATLVPGFKGAILTGAGGSWVEFAFSPKDPVDLGIVSSTLMLPSGEMLDQWHPLIASFETGVGPADNIHYLNRLLKEPIPGRTPPHVLVVEGHVDLQVGVTLQRALVLAIGVDFGGQDVNTHPSGQVTPVLPWAGLRQMPFPISGNRVAGTGQVRTAVVVRYPEDGVKEGHYVSVQLDDPKRKIREFCEAINAGTTPIVR